MTEIKSSVDLTVEAKSIYEAWNWDMLEAQMESGYDRGAFRELVNMYVNMVDNDISLITTIESQVRTIGTYEEVHNGWLERFRNYEEQAKSQKEEIKGYKAITELAVKEMKLELEAAKTWEMHGTAKRIQSTLSQIERLSQ